MAQTEFSSRRVALVVAVLGAMLFTAGLALDVTRDSAYRHFYVLSDASAVALFGAAAAYLRWGRELAARRVGRLAGRVVQGYAVLACLGQALVWVRVSQRGHVWWSLVFLLPMLTAAVLAVAAVHLALRERSTDGLQ